MANRKRSTCILVLIVMLALSTASAGCDIPLLARDLASFGLGWVVRDLTLQTTTDITCLRNGVPIDCSELLQ